VSQQDARRERRRRVLSGELRPLEIHTDQGSLAGHILDLSSQGLSIQLEDSDGSTLQENDQIVLQLPWIDEPLKAQVVYRGREARQGRAIERVGVALLQETESVQGNFARLRFSADSRPVVSLKHPFLPATFVQGEIFELWRDGFQFLPLDERADALIPGLVVQVRIRMKRGEDQEIKIRIQKVTIVEGKKQIECLHMSSSSEDDENLARTILINDQSTRVPDLWRAGFKLKDVKDILEYQVVSSEHEFRRILQLRRMSLAPHLQLQTGTDALVQDPWDSQSEHLYLTLGSHLVAALRLTFNLGNREQIEHKEALERLPQHLWDQGFVEVSRVCTHPEYRGSHLLDAVFHHLQAVCKQSQHRYVVVSCQDSMLDMYQRFGAKPLGIRFHRQTSSPFGGQMRQSVNLLCFDVLASKGKPVHRSVLDKYRAS
jgi:predicted GNAT family N-acyltransferase